MEGIKKYYKILYMCHDVCLRLIIDLMFHMQNLINKLLLHRKTQSAKTATEFQVPVLQKELQHLRSSFDISMTFYDTKMEIHQGFVHPSLRPKEAQLALESCPVPVLLLLKMLKFHGDMAIGQQLLEESVVSLKAVLCHDQRQGPGHLS